MFIKTILRDLADWGSLLRNYLDVLMGVMCSLARWKPRISFLFLPTLERSWSWPRDQPPLKLVTSGAGWCNLVARVRAPHPGSGKSMLSQCSVSEMRERVSAVSGVMLLRSTCRVTLIADTCQLHRHLDTREMNQNFGARARNVWTVLNIVTWLRRRERV